MRLGPIFMPSQIAQSPLKPLRTRLGTLKQTVHLDTTHPHALHAEVFAFSIECTVFQADANTNRLVIQQLLELGQNAEWQRAGVFLTCREDGVADASDGWYILDAVDFPEISRDLGWATGRIDVSLRIRKQDNVGVFADAKLMPNDAGLTTGITLAAFPAGTSTPTYPSTAYSFLASDGSTINVAENPASNLRTSLTAPASTMALGRCSIWDEN